MDASQGSEKPKPTYADFGIDPFERDLCPRCDARRLEIDYKRESWHCAGCGWANSLKDPSRTPIQNAEDAAPSLLKWHEIGAPEGMSYGWPEMDELTKARRGEWTVVTGWPGHGKSQWLQAAHVNMAAKGWKFAIFSPENIPYEEQVKGLAEKFLGKLFKDADRDEALLAIQWLKKRFYFVNPPDFTLESLIAHFWKVVKEHKIQGCLIDPWNEIEHRIPHGMNETQYTTRSLMLWRNFCRDAHVHGWIIAHPRKGEGGFRPFKKRKSAAEEMEQGEAKRPAVGLDDISGSAAWESKPFVGISFWRNPGADDFERHVGHVYVLKNRTKDGGRTGAITLNWDPSSGAFNSASKILSPDDFPAAAEKKRLDEQGGRGWKGAMLDKDPEGWLRRGFFIWKPANDPDGTYEGAMVDHKELRAFLTHSLRAGQHKWHGSVTKKAGLLTTPGEPLSDAEFDTREDAMDFCEMTLADR